MIVQTILNSLSISKKLLLFIFIAFLPATAIIIMSGIQDREREIEAAKNKAILLVQSLAAQQEQIATGTRQMLSTLAQLPEVQRLDAKACNRLFSDLHKQNPSYSVIAAATTDGNMFAASTPFKPGSVNLADRKHIKDAIRTLDFSAGEYIVGRVSRVQSINYTYPVLNADNKLVAIVIAGFKLDEYANFIKKANLPEGYAIAIVDHKGVRLYRLPEHKTAAPGMSIADEVMKQITGELDQGIFEQMSDDGTYRIYAFKQLRLRDDSLPYLYMLVGLAKDEILHNANRNMIVNLFTLGIAALIAMSLTWVIGNFAFVQPISKLVAAANRFGSGELSTRTGLPHKGDEIGQMAKAFDDMATLLELRNSEKKLAEEYLHRYHDHLEKLVKERTTDLEMKNTQLEMEITERMKVEKALQESEELYRVLAEKSFAGVYVVQDGKFQFLNHNAIAYTGYTIEELIGKDSQIAVHPEDRERLKRNAAEMLRGERTFPYEFRIITKEGQTRWFMETVTSIIWKGRRGVLANCMDITERKQMEDQILALSTTDQLTGLHNRRGFLILAEQQLKLAERSKRGMFLFFADLDDMKWINDTLGHTEGDRALMEVATVLKDTFRSSDIIARIGGDEFAVLTIDTTEATPENLTARLQHQIDIHNNQGNRKYMLSISMGHSYYDPDHPSSLNDLMVHADTLMYEQKKSKK